MNKRHKRFVSAIEAPKTGFHNKDGSLTLDGIKTLHTASQSPIWHFSVDLGIKGFKRHLSTIPMLSKKQRNKLVRDYKAKSWGEYSEIIGFKGSFPTVQPII